MTTETDEAVEEAMMLAAWELLDLGWSAERVALALRRDLDWVRGTLDQAARDAAGVIVN